MKRKKDERVLPLGPVLENAVMGSLLAGTLSLKSVRKDELSKVGQVVYRILKDHDSKVTQKSVILAATEVHGIDKLDIKEYLAGLDKDIEIGATLQTLRRKNIVNSLVNEATQQIATGDYSLLPLKGILDSHEHDSKPLSSLADDGEEASPPQGLIIKSLPRLNQSTCGIFGLWVIGGEPKAGKSTLTLQLALSVSRNYRPVLYYDFELGKSVLKWHIEEALQGNKKLIKEATERFYVRTGIHTLESDLMSVNEPCLVVVDSIQKIGSSVQYRRESIDQWVHKLEALKKLGHHVIMVSEVNRATYGEPSGSGYKESGEIEYAADAAWTLSLPDPENPSIVDAYLMFNRHYRKKGLVCQLERVNSWWFKERGHNNA